MELGSTWRSVLFRLSEDGALEVGRSHAVARRSLSRQESTCRFQSPKIFTTSYSYCTTVETQPASGLDPVVTTRQRPQNLIIADGCYKLWISFLQWFLSGRLVGRLDFFAVSLLACFFFVSADWTCGSEWTTCLYGSTRTSQYTRS